MTIDRNLSMPDATPQHFCTCLKCTGTGTRVGCKHAAEVERLRGLAIRARDYLLADEFDEAVATLNSVLREDDDV